MENNPDHSRLEGLYRKEVLAGGNDIPIHSLDHVLNFLTAFVSSMPEGLFFNRLARAVPATLHSDIYTICQRVDGDLPKSTEDPNDPIFQAFSPFRLIPFRQFLYVHTPREQGEIVKGALRIMSEEYEPGAIDRYLRQYANLELGLPPDAEGQLEDLMRELAAHQFAALIGMVNRATTSQRTIVFVSSRTDYKPLRLSIALRKRGYRTFFISMDRLPDDIFELFEREFDGVAVLPFVPALLRGLLECLRPQAFHIQCAMMNYYLGRLVDEAKGTAISTAEFNDITSYFLSREGLYRFYSRDNVDLDWASEAYACHHADIVLHQWAEGFAEQWRFRHGGLRRVLEMQPHAVAAWLPEETEPKPSGDPPRLVWAGQVPGRLSCPPDFNDGYFLGEAVEQLLEQGLAIDIFQNPMHNSQFNDPNLKFYGDLMKRFARFRATAGVRPDLLAKKLAGYDFGLLLFDIDFEKSSASPEKNIFMLTNKLFTYIEAGLPILVNKEYPFMSRFVEENGLGLTFYSHQIREAGPSIRAFDRAACAMRVRAYRARHMMEEEIMALIAAHDDAFKERGIVVPPAASS